MKKTQLDRRKIIFATAGAALGTFVPGATAQDNAQHPPFRPDEAGAIHRDMVSRIGEAVGRKDLNTKEGLFVVISLLQEFGLINEAEAAILRELVQVIYSSDDVNALEKAIETIYQKAKAKGKDLSIAITSIAVSSIRYVKEKIHEHKRAIYIVSADVSSALLGAAGCAKFGPVVAVIGALAGGVAGSSAAAYGSQGKN